MVRLFEAHQKRATINLVFGLPLKQAVDCNLVEKEVHPLEIDGDSFGLSFHPFEIKTIKVQFQ